MVKSWKAHIGAQEKCFSNACDDEFYVVKQLPCNDTFTNTYNSFSDIDEFLDFRNNWKGQNTFNELIREGSPCREYYDIDAKMVDWDGSIDKCLLAFLTLRRDFDQNINDYSVRWDNMIVTEACNDVKLSLHIIVDTYSYFLNTKDQKIWASKFSDWIKLTDSNSKIEIDLSVYNNNSLMRCIGCCKIGDPDRIFKPYGLANNITDMRLFYCSYVEKFLYGDGTSIPNAIPIIIPKSDQKVVKKSCYPILTDDEELENCRQIVMSLKPIRHCYKDWFAIGSALHHVLNGSKEGLEVFLEFSEKDPSSYNEEECIKIWDTFDIDKGCTKGTLIYYFNQDRDSIYQKK